MKCSVEEMLERGERGWAPGRVQREERQLTVVALGYKFISLSWSVLPSQIGRFSLCLSGRSVQCLGLQCFLCVTSAGGNPALDFQGE